MSGLYEQMKADLGYLKLDAAAGMFATLAEQARVEDQLNEWITDRNPSGGSDSPPVAAIENAALDDVRR